MTANPPHQTDPVPDPVSTSESGTGQLPGALLSEEQIRWLRRAVVGMTAVLVAGIALLIGRVIYLARPSGTQAALAATQGAEPALLPEVRLALAAGSVVKSISATGSRVAISHGVPGGADEVTVLDLGTGKVVSHVTIERGK